MNTARILIHVVILILFTRTLFAQTKWFKYEGNPVLDVGASGSWEANAVMPDRIIIENSVYKMWYTGISGSTHRIGYATSPNGVTWTKHLSNPVLDVGPGAWDIINSGHGFVIHSGSTYHMWYFGTDASNRSRIGYASSVDGIAWTKATGSNPIINIGSSGAWDDRLIALTSVIGPNANGGYKMWFHGQTVGSTRLQIGLATSTDSVSWTKYSNNPVVSPGPSGTWDQSFAGYPRVLFDGTTYEMWYAGTNAFPAFRIGYATSFDGITWTKNTGSPVLRQGPALWDAYAVYGGDIIEDGNIYKMWYRGRSSAGDLTLRIGHAVSPKGMSVAVTPTRDSLDRNKDTVRVTVRIAGPQSTLAFFVEIESPDENPVDTLILFDDGDHGDSLAADGVFANYWIPGGKDLYYLDMKLSLHDTLHFEEMDNIKAFSPVTSVIKAVSSKPTSYHLSQNFPNPFNPSTEIQFSLPQRSYVKLTIFDVLGREVATLVSEELSAGSYSTRWDASGMASGVYLYRLRVDEFEETKKLLLLR